MGTIPDVFFAVALSVIGSLYPAQPVAASHVRLPVTRIQTVKPTIMPTQVILPSPTATPTKILKTQPVIERKDSAIMIAINSYRLEKGLPAVKPDPHSCNFARIRAKEIAANFSHDEFQNRQKNHTLPYPTYSLVTENIAYTKDSSQVVTLWINSQGHALNMLLDTPFICVEQFGDYYAYEGWKS